jgi:outer membrane protein
MKNLPLVFSSLSLVGVAVLLGMKLTEPKSKSNLSSSTKQSVGVNANTEFKIGYVDIDTLESQYGYFKKRKTEFEARQKTIDAELERMANSLSTDYINLQKRAEKGELSQSEGEAAQQSLMKRQQELEVKRQNLAEKYLKDQEAFNKEIHDNLHAYIEKYNEEKGYDYILSYSKDGSILFANKALDVTQDIVDGMNSEKKEAK